MNMNNRVLNLPIAVPFIALFILTVTVTVSATGKDITNKEIVKAREINIFEAINIAMSSNPELMSREARIRAAEAKRGQVKSAFWPRLTLESEYMRTDAPRWIFSKIIDSREISMQSDFNDPPILDNVENGISFKYNLYRGGIDRRSLDQSEFFNKISKFQYDETLNYIVLSVIVSYYDVLAARDRVKVAEESVNTVKSQLRSTDILYENGAALKSDVLSLKVRLAEAKDLLLTSKNSYELAMVAFKTILGQSLHSSYLLSDHEWKPMPVPETPEKALAMAKENRGIVNAAAEGIKTAEAEISKALGGYLPEANMWGSYYYDDSNPKFDMDEENWVVAFRMDWTIFDGFLTKNRIAEARAGLDEAEAEMKKALLHIERDVRSAYLNLSAAKDKLAVAAVSVEQAEESLRLVKLSYEGGAANITRYLDAELDLTTARTLNIKASYDVKKAIANCFYATGYCGICVQMEAGEKDEK